MSIFNSFDISASGMTAQRFRTDIISQNIANAIAIMKMNPPIAFTELSTASFTVNINPRKKRITGKME